MWFKEPEKETALSDYAQSPLSSHSEGMYPRNKSKYQSMKVRRKPLCKMATLCMLLIIGEWVTSVSCQAVTQQCKDISVLPSELMVTESRDDHRNLTDIHVFNRFFTYQLPHDARPKTNIVATKFKPSSAHWRVKDKQGKARQFEHSGEEDLLLRLRATFNAAKMDESDQGMRVSVIEDESKRVVVDASTEDVDERNVHLDSIHISSKHVYTIQYEFFEKSPVKGNIVERTIAGSHMGSVGCSKPFVVQELAIISKELVHERARLHLSHQDKYEHDISMLPKKCDFSMLDNTKVDLERGENGLYCQKEHYHYSLVGESPQDLNTIFEKKFKVAGAQNEPLTMLFDMTLTFEFAVTAQIKALIRRLDPGHSEAEYIYDPLACLYDHSCIEASQIGKNELNIDVILTSGEYELIIFDQQENEVRNWLTSSAGLKNVPFSFELQATPIVQNEERVMCSDKLYLVDSFIQHRFIDGRDGQKFVFEDSILLNVVNNTQHVQIAPEQDMLLKVSAKEAYGVNMKMSLCEGGEDVDDDWKLHLESARCPVHSSQVGNNELLYATVSKGKSYVLVLDYTNSILSLSSFYDCPHTQFKLAMMNLEEANKIVSQHDDRERMNSMMRESEQSLAHFFDSISREQINSMEHRMEPKQVYHYPLETKMQSKSQSHVVTRRDFSIPEGQQRQILFEVFYDSQFYDLELLIESKDAPEVKAHGRSNMQSSDMAKFKGAKRILTDLEHGDYTFLVIAKLPGISSETNAFAVRCFEFQLYAVSSEVLKNRAMIANSLNLLGLLGVKGSNFGQMLNVVPLTMLQPLETIEFSFTLGESEELNPFLDIQIIDADGKGDQLDIKLYEVHYHNHTEEAAAHEEHHNTPGHPHEETPKETLSHPQSSRYFDDWEEGVSFLALASSDLHANKNYRLVVKNRDTAAVVRAKIKIMVTENTKAMEDVRASNFPQDFDEIKRIKPKVPGLKESSFIQGSNAVMRTFNVASLAPFVPKSKQVYQTTFQTGESSDNTFMKGIEFDVSEHSSQIFAQVFVMQAQHDLFMALYRLDDQGTAQITARSSFGKYVNTLGPAPLVPGKYRLVVHPNQESTSLPQGSHGFKFGLDVLLEESEIGGASDFTSVVEEVEMCNHRQMPDTFNGPGFIGPLSGFTLQHFGKYRLADVLEGTSLKFDLPLPSLVTFYFEVPEGLQAEASLETVKGTHQTVVTTKDLNKDDETFLRQDGGFSHRGVIQIREFLSAGPHVIRLLAWEIAGGHAHQAPRCEAFDVAVSVSPLNRTQKGFPIGEECLNTQYMQEHLVFDEVKEGNLAYPLSENTPDVAYIDLKPDGEGPFLFYFQVQHDQRLSGLLGVTLSKYDPQTSGFKQAALYSSPQDGIVQLFAIVESGTYAIGIQTLTSTRSVFIASGLSGKFRVDVGSNLLPETCLHLRYTYLIASSTKGDAKQFHGSPLDFMSLMFGGGIGKLVEEQARDSSLLDEVGDQSQLSSCVHDDLPPQLPIGETGFDQQYKILVQMKPSDTMDLVIEQDSVVRVHVHTYNPKNQVRAFIYANGDKDDKKPLGYSVGGRSSSTLFMPLRHEERAYRLVLEYESLDQDDPCPLAHIRIITKPVNDTIRENLVCRGKPLPPSTVPLKTDDVVVSGEFAFPGDWLAKAVKDPAAGMEYDIVLEWPFANPNATYYLDIETRSDFLTGQVSFNLMYEHSDKTLRPLGHSVQVGTAMEGGELVHRLKLLDREGDLADDIDISGAILRLKLPDHAFDALRFAKESGLVPEGSELCHNFELSIRAEVKGHMGGEAGHEAESGPSRLMRVRWEGHETNHDLFDPRTRLYASLEFDRSMKSHFQMLKTADWVALQPIHTGIAGSTNTQPDVVKPLSKSIHGDDASTIVLEFAAGTLAKGWCHKLQLISIGGPFGQLDFDEALLAKDLELCTTNCLCDQVGTSSCDEATGHCICKHSHAGDTCSNCEQGFTKDPQTKECQPQSLCKANGGNVDCNGHGSCRQQGGTAICTCAPGFKNDGLAQCAKCVDPMFDYPKCQIRSFIIEDPAISCHGLPNTFPASLFEEGPDHRKEDPTQGPDGVIDWTQRFRLLQNEQETKYSNIQFMVPQTSVVRFFVDTAKSGVLVKFRLLDADSQEVFSSSTYEGTDDSYLGAATEIAIVHRPEGKEAHEAPYTLQLEFKHVGLAKEHHQDDEFCPIVDVRLVVEPFNTAATAIKCKDDQQMRPYKTNQEPWAFSGMTRAVTQKVALHSDDVTMYEHDEGKTNNFALLRYSLAIRNSGNALTILATYPFSELQMSMRLIDDRTGGVVSLHRTSSLEGEHHSSNVISLSNDMATFIEEPRIEAGLYTLEIAIPKAIFLPTKEHSSCLNFDLVVEYVSRTHGQNAEHDGLYDVIAVRPLSDKQLWKTDEKVIDVDFDRGFEFDDLVGSLADRRYICSLYNRNDQKNVIHPVTATQEEGSTLRLYFNFTHEAHIPHDGRCYSLKCSTKKSKGTELIRQPQDPEFCFESEEDHAKKAAQVCNPHAMPYLNDDGSCVCADPYTGHDCQTCQEGFKAAEEVKDGNVECVIDEEHMSKAVCNSHGRPQSGSTFNHIEQVKCECDKGYGGQYCDFCSDAEYAFPDCSPETSSIIYNTEMQHSFLSRQRYDEHGYSTVAERYFPEDALEPSIFNEECGWVDYPDSFDRTELMREFSSGDFHIADTYVVNHKQDNVVKFKPRTQGHLKILLQQPETQTVSQGPAEAFFDLEIGIYDPHKKSFIQSSMNSHLRLSSGTPAKLEYAALSFKVLEEHLDKPLYIFFRALNFTDDGTGHAAAEGCLTLYMEAEFKQSMQSCRSDPHLQQSSDIQTLRSSTTGQVSTHSINDPSQTFFTYQDYYLPEDRSLGEAPYEVTISLQQKFHESNTLDIIVEVLQQDVQLENINKEAHRPSSYSHHYSSSESHSEGTAPEEEKGRAEDVKGQMGPKCAGTCMIGGEKAYNEMIRVIDLDAMTYFRVWLMQAHPAAAHDASHMEPCANYQLFVRATPSNRELSAERKMSQQLKCPSEELPPSLDTARYLRGPDGSQKDFHYSQAYRVDHLWHNQAHQMKFTLKEQTVVRIAAPVHRHLEFDIVLNHETGSYSHELLMRAKKEDHHIAIFALLEKGTYHFKLEFMSDAALLQLPCQTVHLEVAMMQSQVAKDNIKATRTAQRAVPPVNHFALSDLFKHSGTSALVMLKEDFVQLEHVHADQNKKVEASDLFVELFRESFEVAEDDNIGVFIEVQSDFLLAGAHVVLQNTITGTIMEDERHEGTSSLSVALLAPGKYVVLVYTHKCITNIQSEEQRDIKSFDALIDMRLRPLRKIHGGQLSQAMVPIKLTDSTSEKEGDEQVTPLLATEEELHCKSEYLSLPDELDPNGLVSQIDWSENFFLPTFSYSSHQIQYTARKDQYGLRILLAKSNAKVSLLNDESRKVVAESRPIDDGQAQLLIATELQEGTKYIIILEFSQKHGAIEGQGLGRCHNFILAVKTASQSQIQHDHVDYDSQQSLQSPTDGQFRDATIQMKKKTETRQVTIPGSNNVDLQLVLDYSASFYPPDLTLIAGQRGRANVNGDLSEEEKEEVQLITSETTPTLIGFNRKQATTYLFVNVVPGTYDVIIHQRFKSKDTISPVTLSYRSWPAGASTATLERGGMQGLQIYQSESEEQEQPRAANRLPLDLNSYKFMGAPKGTSHQSENVLFSGAVQLDEQESQNHITFQVETTSLLRVYVERAGLILQLEQIDGDHNKPMPGMLGSTLLKKINKGHYRIKVREGTSHGRKNSRITAPRAHMTLVLAEQKVEQEYNKTWSSIIDGCDSGASFPLALRQQKQADIHQLFYDYPLIKVDPSILRSRAVLQTYNFRVNVTSRMYFEVGMHMHSQHVTMQLSSLNEKAYTVQGKQRGNLNIIDIQIGPGDYSVAIKQPTLSPGFYERSCGLFSLQGLVEPISMMSEESKTGEIVQRGVLETCSEQASASDVLPMKIHGSEGTTRGGGELHIDATGHFNKKFRNVLFQLNEDSISRPQSDRINIEVLEDSWLHLSFQYKEQGFNQIKATLVDTLMLGQPVSTTSSFGINNIEGDMVEQVYQYHLIKGHHYTLTVQYIGSAVRNEEGNPICSFYDLSMSISRNTQILLATQCPAKDDVQTVHEGLPKTIQDSDLDHDGNYNFTKMLRVDDFTHGGQTKMPVIAHAVSLELSKNFDFSASIEFEYDQAMYSMQLNEVAESETTDGSTKVQSHLRLQQPLLFKQNDDHQRTAVRELTGDGIEAGRRDEKRIILFFYNHEPNFLPTVYKDSPMGGHGSCLFLKFNINIRSSEQQTEQLYANAQQSRKGVSPQIMSCWPADSPTFLHDKPESLSFDIVFNKQPYLKDQDTSQKTENLMHLREAIKLKATIISLADGMKSQIQIQAANIYANNKEYRDDEFHVGVVFDISEFARSATEKVMHAQLHISQDKLVDEDQADFTTEQHLEMRGLPIYVFEETDVSQIVKEETDDIQQAVANETVGIEAQAEQGADIASTKSDLEQEVQDVRAHEQEEAAKEQVKCECIHGTCIVGQSTCNHCDHGWSGPHCDTPTNDETLQNVNQNQKKDFTEDGLYQPQQTSDDRKTGTAKEKTEEEKEGEQEQPAAHQGHHEEHAKHEDHERHEHSKVQQPRKIDDDDVWGERAHERVEHHQQEQKPHFETHDKTNLHETISEKTQTEQDSSKNLQTGALVASVVVFFYCLCFKKGQQQNQVPKRRYGALGAKDPDSDSDGDGADDPRERRKMLELSSFGDEGKKGAYRRGKKDSGMAGTNQTSPDSTTRGSFPMASFSSSSQKSNMSATSSSQAQARQSPFGGAGNEADDAGEQLQRELELFAQDDDAEEQALMNEPAGYTQQNQDAYGGNQYGDPQSYSGAGSQDYQQNEAGQDDLDELEKYFDQKNY